MTHFRNIVSLTVLAGCLLGAPALVSAQAPPTAAAPGAVKMSADQLQQLLAPIALYPDSLLSQILMAATYPLDIVDADRWAQAHATLSASDRTAALAQQHWDASATSLVQFPQLLHRMSLNLDWTQAVGEAYLLQPKDVTATVQQLRTDAYQAGALKSSEQQTVTSQDNTIVIQPASPEVVYVPSYDPSTIYGSDYAAPSTLYYPNMWAYANGDLGGNGLNYGVGVTVGDTMFGSVNWSTGSLYCNSTYMNQPLYAGAYGATGYHGGAYGGAYGGYSSNAYHGANGANGTAYHGAYGGQGYKGSNGDSVYHNANGTAVHGANGASAVHEAGGGTATNSQWNHDANERQGVNYQNSSLQNKYGGSGSSAYKGYPSAGAEAPHASTSAYSGAHSGGFDNYAGARGAASTGFHGGGFSGGGGFRR